MDRQITSKKRKRENNGRSDIEKAQQPPGNLSPRSWKNINHDLSVQSISSRYKGSKNVLSS